MAGPTLVISAPGDGALVSAPAVTVSGTATDCGRGDSGVASVTVNGITAQGGAAATCETANWSVSVPLAMGSNLLVVVASDSSPEANTTTHTLRIHRPRALALGGQVSGELVPAGDEDHFLLVLSTAGRVTLSSGGSTDTYGYLLDAAGNVLLEDDDSGGHPNFRLQGQLDPGSYYLRVTGATAATVGAYTVASVFSPGLSGATRAGDFNADGRSDLLWRHPTDGRNAVWLLNGPTVQGNAYLPTVGSGWTVVARGDFDGDGKADLLWREAASGRNAVWLMNGTGIKNSGYLPTVAGTGWSVVAAGDYDGDGKADLVWRDSATGRNAVWLLNGTTLKGSGNLPTVAGTTWAVVASGDFDGDGKSDLLWREAASGRNAVWLLNGSALKASGYLPDVGGTWSVVASGDYDGDGKADLVWRDSATGRNAVWLLNGSSLKSSGNLPGVTGTAWAVVAGGDFDGDGRGDLLWREAASGRNALWYLNGTALRASAYLPNVVAPWTPVPTGVAVR